MSKASWLWPYCWRKGAEQPDLQQCKLPVKEGSTATWCTIFLTVSQTIVGREQSDLMDSTICSCTNHCWKGAKWPDRQHYLQLHRLLLEGSVADWLQHKLNNAELVEGSRRAGGPDENLVYYVCCTKHGSDACWLIVPNHSHTLSFYSKILQNSNKFK